MYKIEELKAVGRPHVLRMSFEMANSDWCKFEKTAVFRQLASYLREVERSENSMPNCECAKGRQKELESAMHDYCINTLKNGFRNSDVAVFPFIIECLNKSPIDPCTLNQE